MSSTTEMSYVYIPNLVGRQMLRIPALSLNDEPEISSETEIPEATPSLTFDITDVKSASLSGFHRNTSPSVSVESVDEAE
ncbi:hypothetical protein P280DRAFT_465325 [Massarina eburnea CBS 473.64]|uniref:Uncharacterized protein n=1 Tax=Massarina eburnea CBS 473.64 TaxID=1395130 RepID=A0A6A6SGZ9_9PLEO|nr:hypothetical protein P280DRAFT_465325 [Massarina eburnea CBS 473.64]